MLKYKQNRKLIDCICDNCGNTFQKPLSEYNRNLTLKRHNFCSRSCVGKSNISKLPKYDKEKSYDISKHAGERADKYSPFRGYIKKAKQRFKECTITLEDLKNQWELQKGICPYSGVQLKLITHTIKSDRQINSASLDRIDSSKGYTKDNIQFVSIPLNYMKNNLTHEETIEICKQIAKYFNSL